MAEGVVGYDGGVTAPRPPPSPPLPAGTLGAPPLLTEAALEQTATVANNRMNRERVLRGANGYDRELGFDPTAILAPGGRWLDVACGTARALFDAEQILGPGVEIVGLDLVEAFWRRRPADSRVRLVVGPVREYTPTAPFDLITCVHGLHYVGDKLGALLQLRGWLRPGGRLVAHLDPNHIVLNGRPGGAAVVRLLAAAGFTWDARRHRVGGEGRARWPPPPPVRYLGAREAGPNYTGQPAVESHYTADGGPNPTA